MDNYSEERPYRGRHLETWDDERIWQHNTWDEIPWTEAQEQNVQRIINEQRTSAPLLSEEELRHHCAMAADKWDSFYTNHSRWFFKDRKWLELEFPELFKAENKHIWEVGCGAGNTLFPLAKRRKEILGSELEGEMLYASDFSMSAVELVRNFREYDPLRMSVFHNDLLSPLQIIPSGSIDVILAIFVFSALPPSSLYEVFDRLYSALKPGGILLFRDYGRGDLTQLRLKPSRLLSADCDFYQRGDGTDVHFFTPSECQELAERAGFIVQQNITDRRVIVNRLRKLTMFRVWQQAKFIKPNLNNN